MSRTPPLERLLDDLPPEQVLKVRSLFADFELSPDDPLFLVLLSISSLTVLLDDGPRQLQEILEQHQGKVQDWSKQNLHILHALATEAKSLQELASSAPEAKATAERLQQTSTRLGNHLTDAEETLENLLQQQTQLVTALGTLVQTQGQQTQKLAKNANRLERSLRRPAFLDRHVLQPLVLTLTLGFSVIGCWVSLRVMWTLQALLAVPPAFIL